MRGSRIVLAAAALALLAGCGQDEEEAPGGRTPYEELTIASDTAEGFGSDQPAGVTPVQGGATLGGVLTATGNLQGTRPDSPPGSVTITEEGDGSRVLISIRGATAGAQFQPTFVAASCNAQGAVVHTVPETLTVSGEGIGTLETTVPIPADRLLDGRHSIRLTTPQSQPTADVILACADLPHTVGAEVQ